jgi:hypothetical protein
LEAEAPKIEPRVPWWGHNATQEALDLGRRFKNCDRSCGAKIIVVQPPRDSEGRRPTWTPMEMIGFDEEKKTRVMAIHWDLCTDKGGIPEGFEPTVSHRVPTPPRRRVVIEPRRREHGPLDAFGG